MLLNRPRMLAESRPGVLGTCDNVGLPTPLMLRAGTRIGDGSSVTRQRTHPNNCDHSGVVLRWAIIEDKASAKDK